MTLGGSTDRAAPVATWTLRGPRARFDDLLDEQVRRAAGPGHWQRHCAVCGGDDHGRRMYVADGRTPFAVSVSHAGAVHVAATGWGRLDVGIDIARDELAAEDQSVADAGARWLERWLAASSLARLDALPDAERRAATLSLWAAREAVAKSTGTGLDDHRAAVPLLLPADGSSEPSEAVTFADLDGWWLRRSVHGHVCVLFGSRPFRVD